MAKALILGARGNLGQQLAKAFEPDYELIAWDRGEIDITDRELIIKKIIDLKPAVVINAAAYNSVDKCEADDAEYDLAKKINIDGPKFIAEACLATRSLFIHYSSDYVFNGDKKSGYQEDDEPRPANRYGKTKYHGEKRILELSGRGLRWYLIRTSKLFGPAGLSDLAKPSFFDLMLKKGQEQLLSPGNQKKPLEIVNEEKSCFTYTPDLARATKELAESNSAYGVYHLVNGRPDTWYAAAKELFKLAKLKISVLPVKSDKYPRPAKRPKFSVLLNSKRPPLRDYRDALKEYIGK